jgi:hypothetical protein
MALKRTLAAACMVAAMGLGAAAPALAHGSAEHGPNPDCPRHHGWYMGPGMMGQGMGPGCGMMDQDMGPGYGMMGQGMGRGYGMMDQGMGPGYGMGQGMGPGMMAPLREDLSVADVRHMMEHRLAWNGNPHIKVGKVEESDDDTIVADIVTQDGSLVQKLEVDRHTGWTHPAQ